MRVLKFSIGFGPPIGFGRFRLAWQRSGTDYVIAWFPLGGFVKMLGENPDEIDDPEVARRRPGRVAAPTKPLWQKLAIVFAGPAMNLMLPVLVFVGDARRGHAAPDRRWSAASSPDRPRRARACARATGSSRSTGEPVTWWDDLEDAVRERAGRDA